MLFVLRHTPPEPRGGLARVGKLPAQKVGLISKHGNLQALNPGKAASVSDSATEGSPMCMAMRARRRCASTAFPRASFDRRMRLRPTHNLRASK